LAGSFAIRGGTSDTLPRVAVDCSDERGSSDPVSARRELAVADGLSDEELCTELECTPEFLDWARAEWGDDGPEQLAAVMRDPKTEDIAVQMEVVLRLEAQGIEVDPPEGFTAAEWEEERRHLPPPLPLNTFVAFKLRTGLGNGRAPRRRRSRSRSPRSSRPRVRSSSAASRDGPESDSDPDLDQPGLSTGRRRVEEAA